MNCVICERQKNEDPAVVYSDDFWIVRHSRETNILGYLLIESKRHFLDLSESDDAECRSIGPLLRAVIASIRDVVKPERVYTVTLAEAVPHFHIHVIPRNDAIPKVYRGRGILSYPLEPASDPHLFAQACTKLRRRMTAASRALRAHAVSKRN